MLFGPRESPPYLSVGFIIFHSERCHPRVRTMVNPDRLHADPPAIDTIMKSISPPSLRQLLLPLIIKSAMPQERYPL